MGATIPLPALGIRGPDPNEGSDNMLRAIQMRSLLQSQQGQQQEQQLRGIQVQQQQMALQDQQRIMEEMQNNQGKTIGDILPNLRGKITPQSYFSLQQADLKMQQEYGTKTKTDLENDKAVHDQLQELYNNLRNMPDDQLAQLSPQIVQRVNSMPGSQFKLPPGTTINQQMLQQFGPVLGLNEAYLNAEMAKQEKGLGIATKEAALPGVQAESLKKGLEAGALAQVGGMTEDMYKAAYGRVVAKLQLGQSVSPEEFANANAYVQLGTKTGSTSSTQTVLGLPSGITTTSSTTSGPPRIGGGGRGVIPPRAAVGGAAGAPQPAPGSPSAPATAGAPQGGPTNLIDMIGTGKIAMNRLEYVMARSPAILEAVSQKYPGFDSSKVKAYIDAYKDFTGPRGTGGQITAGAIAMQHLKQLKDINDANPVEVRIMGTAANKAYNNLLDTVADELMTFYGEPKTNEARASKIATMGGLANRDAAILQQANAMGVRLDEFEQKWNNAAPSAAYEAPMPNISRQAKAARAALDPAYNARYQEEQQQNRQGTPSTVPQGDVINSIIQRHKNASGR